MLLNTQSIITVHHLRISFFYAFRNIEIGAPCFQHTTLMKRSGGFDFGACHGSRFGRKNGNAIDLVKLTDFFYVFIILK